MTAGYFLIGMLSSPELVLIDGIDADHEILGVELPNQTSVPRERLALDRATLHEDREEPGSVRPIPARILLSVLAISALAAGVVTSQIMFYVVGLMAGVFLVTSLTASRNPLARALLRFRDRAVVVRLWGATPSLPPPAGATLLLTSVNVLGAGTHVFFRIKGGDSLHLKVAQPRNVQLGPDAVVVGSAKYVQWRGKKLPVVAGAAALFVGLSDGSVPDRRPGVS